MTLISLNDFKNLEEYQVFAKENPDVGYLKVHVFTAYGAIPVPNTSILITKDIGDYKVIFFQGDTDLNGMISNIELPAPKAVSVSDPDVVPEYTLYDMTAIHAGYESLKKYSVAMFGDVKIIQYVKMNPSVNVNEGVDKNAS